MASYGEAQRITTTGIEILGISLKQKKTRRSGPSRALWCNVLPRYHVQCAGATKKAQKKGHPKVALCRMLGGLLASPEEEHKDCNETKERDKQESKNI